MFFEFWLSQYCVNIVDHVWVIKHCKYLHVLRRVNKSPKELCLTRGFHLTGAGGPCNGAAWISIKYYYKYIHQYLRDRLNFLHVSMMIVGLNGFHRYAQLWPLCDIIDNEMVNLSPVLKVARMLIQYYESIVTVRFRRTPLHVWQHMETRNI